MPPSKRKKRVYESNALTRQGVNLSEERNYQAWRKGPRAAPYWAIFEKGFLESPQYAEGQKGDEFLNVYNQITAGEADGAGRFSSDGAEKTLTTGLEWQAWLLLKLVQNNTLYRNGCLYGSTEPKSIIYERMWNTIKNELRNRSRNAKRAAKAPKSAKPRKSKTDHSSTSEEELDPKSGTAMVTWANMPLSLRKSGCNEEIFGDFCGMDFAGFRTAVQERFKLKERKHIILELSESSNLAFADAQALAAHDNEDGVFFSLKTRKAVLEEETALPPVPLVATPAGQETKDQKEHRRLAWEEMVSEARNKGANKLDLNVRLWLFSFLKSFSKGDATVDVENMILRLDEINDEEPALQVCCSHFRCDCSGLTKHQYTHGLLDLARSLSDTTDANDEKAEDAEGPPLTRYREITQREKDEFRKQNEWLDNKDYQRDDHKGACEFLGIENPDRPRIDGLYPSRYLESYQPTAIEAMVRFEDSDIKGGLLADDMGLGKTVEIIGLMLFRLNQRRLATSNEQPVDKAMPTLILMPKVLLTQWKDEILRFTDQFRIVIYYGSPKKSTQEGVVYHKGKLERTSEYFNGDEINASTIIMSTYSTWGIRHGPKAQTEWLVSNHVETHKVTRLQARNWVDKTYAEDVATKDSGAQLQDCFERVILDEGHEIRNMSAQVGTAVRWVGGKYRNVVTGTPTLSGLHDFCGIMRFLQPLELESAKHLRKLGFPKAKGRDALKNVLKMFDPWSVEDDDPKAILKFTEAALEEWVFHRNTTMEMRGIRMRSVFKGCMIRRSLSSVLNGKRIGDALPDVQRINIECEFTDIERQYYEHMYADTSSRLFKKNSDGGSVAWNTTTYRKLCLITAWLGMAYLLKYKALVLKKIREKKGNAIRFLEDVRAGQARRNVPEEDQCPIPEASDIAKLIELHCTGSPKLRQLLAIAAELVVLQGEKITVWVNNPFQMEWLDSVSSLWLPYYICNADPYVQVLKLCGLKSRQLRADLTTDERDKLIKQFLSDPDAPQVLICSYLISCAGVNMHLLCRTVIEFEPAPCQGSRDQTVGRVRRKGQPKFCRHITLVTKNSFNTQQDAVTLLRSLPSLMTQLDLDVFGKRDEEMDRDHALGDWVLYNNDLIPASDAQVAGKNLPVLDPDTLLMYISLKMAGQKLEGDILSLRQAAKGLKQNKPAEPTAPLWQ